MADQAPTPKDFLEEVHGKPLEGLEGVDFRSLFSYTPEDIKYILSRRPFFQILNVDATFEKFEKVKIIKSSTGWNIHYLVDAIGASPGEYLFGGSANPFGETIDELFGQSINPGHGTIVNQAFVTAIEAVQLIKKEWPGVHIVSGDDISQWAIWVAAQELDLPVIGYEPKDLELAEKKRQRLRLRNRAVIDALIRQQVLQK